MAEVTATTVPGERVVADREGSWGRHLPAVDDLLSLPAGQPVRIFSSYGVTTLTAPSTLANWRNRLKLLVDYERLARARVRALSSDEPSVQSAYAIDLEERYGVELHFQPEGAEPAPTGLHGLALPASGKVEGRPGCGAKQAGILPGGDQLPLRHHDLGHDDRRQRGNRRVLQPLSLIHISEPTRPY